MSKHIDTSYEIFGTFAKKDLQLHRPFKKPEIVQRVRKEVEEYTESIVITKEVVREARKRTQQVAEERPVKVEPTGLEASTPSQDRLEA